MGRRPPTDRTANGSGSGPAIRDRRQHVRIKAKGAVVLRVAATPRNGRIVDVSAGGLLIVTHVTPPESWLGRTVEVEIRLDDARSEWMHGSGRVVRICADGLAFAFEQVPPSFVRVLDELGHASRTRRRTLAVVLIDADPVRRSAMVTGFREVGCAVVEATTPLEAIVRLGESSFEPDVIAIADSQPAAGADALRAFTQQNHPHAKLVTIGNERAATDALQSWLSSEDPAADLPQRIRAMLSRL